jgi:3-methyladenine DNA glycosylase AlkD
VGGGDGVDDRQAQAVAGVRVSAPRAESLEGLEQAGRGPSRVFVRRRRVVYLSGVTADVELIGAVRAALRGAAQPELARPMQAYMKSATPFLGVRVPVMRTLTRAEAKLRPFITSADLIDTVLRLWREAGYREERYAAIALLDTPAARRLRDPAVLQTLQELIVTGAWWDYVDELAHRVGDLLLSWPAEVRPAVLTWTRSDDRWPRRT